MVKACEMAFWQQKGSDFTFVFGHTMLLYRADSAWEYEGSALEHFAGGEEEFTSTRHFTFVALCVEREVRLRSGKPEVKSETRSRANDSASRVRAIGIRVFVQKLQSA
jgi:hypothetical protein